ncbi:MAG TPA: carbohydrate kinase [Paracoccaceae bacterium]|nr:carbohydrate kinase [Paracoccaceae bacterium]
MILCCGEALIDMIPTPTVSGGNAFASHSGGAIFNTAIALGRLGAQTGMLTGLSTDLFGRQLEKTLRASNVDTSLVIQSARPTTLAFVELTDGHASYTFYDENTAGRMLAEQDLPELPDDVNCLYFGGISLCSEPGADAYRALALREAADRVIMIDPNIRASFIQDIDTYRARLNSILAVADVVKVSDEDLNWIMPGPESLAEKVAKVKAAGPSVVIMTRGAEGAIAHLNDGATITVPANKVEIVDTVGAGDTFNAGVLANLAENGHLTKAALKTASAESIRKALEFGAKVAAVTVSRAGANPPWSHELA